MVGSLGVRLSPQDRRTLAIGAAIIGSLVGTARGIPAVLQWRADALRSAGEIRRDLADAERSIRRARSTQDTLAAREARLRALDAAFLAGRTSAEIGSSAALLIAEAASASGSQLGSIEMAMDSVRQNSVRVVSVRAQVSGDIAAISQFLASLESGPVLLRITELSLAASDAVNPVDRRQTLRAEIAVKGVARPSPRGGDQR